MANRPRVGRLSPAERATEARRLRDDRKLTQRGIAERLDVSPSTIAKDLHGLDRMPDATASADSSRPRPVAPAAPGDLHLAHDHGD